MQLSPEDSLRLNVLLSQSLQAVRIDESRMIVYALTEKGEAKVPLCPTGKDEAYIREVKALFSTHVMGSPGGYPVFLKRWTRMGQARDESLAAMLLLGEEEAVVAAVHAPGLTDELAARAWWAMPTSENARRMLEKQAVVEGETGKVLAEFLLEFLPFEEDQNDMIESVRLVLQPGLISDEEKQKLWARTKTRKSFFVGFLHGAPDSLPVDVPAHPDFAQVERCLQTLAGENVIARLLIRVFSPAGQAFVKTVEEAWKKPGNQDVVISLLAAVQNYFQGLAPAQYTAENIECIEEEMRQLCRQDSDENLHAVLDALAPLENRAEWLTAMLVLSCVSVKLVNDIFAHTDAIGTVMRKKIKPVSDGILRQCRILRG